MKLSKLYIDEFGFLCSDNNDKEYTGMEGIRERDGKLYLFFSLVYLRRS